MAESDDTDSEPPRPYSFERPSHLQSIPCQSALQTTDSQLQRQVSDKLSSPTVNIPHHDPTPIQQTTYKPIDVPAGSSSLPQTILQSLSSSPHSPDRPYSVVEVVAVHDTIIEEDDETDYDTPNEPVTPNESQQSKLPHSNQDYRNHAQRHPRHRRTLSNTSDGADLSTSPNANGSLFSNVKSNTPVSTPARHAPPPLTTTGLDQQIELSRTAGLLPESPTSARPSTAVNGSFLIGPPTSVPNTQSSSTTAGHTSPSTDTAQGAPLTRRQSRTSTSSFKRTMSSFFRRSTSEKADKADKIDKPEKTSSVGSPELNNVTSESSLIEMAINGTPRKVPARRWSMHRSLANTPPSPNSPPLEMVAGARHGVSTDSTTATTAVDPGNEPRTSQNDSRMPTQDDFLQNDSKKHRQRASTTGINFQSAIHIVTGGNAPLGSRKNKPKTKARTEYRRRASSFDHGTEKRVIGNASQPWAMPAEAGTGLKARRMSLSLPDDFTVDVVDLHSEFDYQHMLGRHRRHIGKGATSKVTLMFRKGFPDELYAVKEFRGKSSSETPEEYEKKVKSEYSIAKSLHHPNIVETIRLCTDHGRWNHVMEYCQEGDLYSLVEKKYLTTPEREKDRVCLFKQLIQGLNYLHQHGVAHRDIKLENLLITNNSKLKITDFGASDIFSGMHPGLREAGGRCGRNTDKTVRLCKPGICGSLPYISPEVLEGTVPYDPRKLDVWAAAIVMLNLIFGGPLWTEARLVPGQANPQYQSLLRGWEKYNRNHLPGRLAAEKEHADKVAAEQSATATGAPASPASTPADGGADLTETVSQLSIQQVASAAAAAHAAQNGAAPVPTALTSSRPTVDGTPITDGNPNSLVEGSYPAVSALDICVNPPLLRRVLIQMLNPDPSRRPTIEQIANLRWIRAIECCQPESYEDPMAPAVTTGNVRGGIDASKRSTTNIGGQKVFCHNHLPPKTHSHAIVRVP
ncbi:serine/threonineeeee-protein kinase [Sporothrix brasiliensis 5110]|uniref:Serine/threonineeeee-protein kinase n=1 Tax=Sporothrix brasiliensis 5110 TaxID=1398154 RepID=A0A0C2IE68_9PEZI|nr:serine/threonineeeee-protein kinase [Sporothrix brasiliensis 5110]KIH87556.1 serine/threonineeeee-protein kinase [Sporothrix brasiliensis 5110]